MPVDFIPDACAGASIFDCFALKECNLSEIINDLENPLSDLAAGFDASFGVVVEIQATLDLLDACIVAAVTEAFIIAGEPFPTLPPPDIPADFSSVSDELTDMADEITTPLGYLDSIFTLEDDGTKITRIQSA